VRKEQGGGKEEGKEDGGGRREEEGGGGEGGICDDEGGERRWRGDTNASSKTLISEEISRSDKSFFTNTQPAVDAFYTICGHGTIGISTSVDSAFQNF
jgi:hypothetical protein